MEGGGRAKALGHQTKGASLKVGASLGGGAHTSAGPSGALAGTVARALSYTAMGYNQLSATPL